MKRNIFAELLLANPSRIKLNNLAQDVRLERKMLANEVLGPIDSQTINTSDEVMMAACRAWDEDFAPVVWQGRPVAEGRPGIMKNSPFSF